MLTEVRNQVRGGCGSIDMIHIFDRHELKGKSKIIAKLIIESGCSVGKHNHDNEEEIYYILKGKGKVDDNGSINDIYEGDAIIIGGGEYHSICNDGEATLEILAVVLLFE